MRPRSRALLVAVTALTFVLPATLSGCTLVSGASTGSETPTPQASSAAEQTSTASPGVTDDVDFAAAYAERDEFITAQQQPLDGSNLTAKTPEQKEFISQQRAYLESQGVEWTVQHESFYLAMTLDACETSILNGHVVSTEAFIGHVATDPVVGAIVDGLSDAQREAATANLMSIAVFGTGFICPDDAAQWRAAYDEVYG